jgi:hypothetical protein
MTVDKNKALAVRFFEALDTGNIRFWKTSSRTIVSFIGAI